MICKISCIKVGIKVQAFGVGSFFFSLDFSKTPANLTIGSFVNEVRRVLESIHSVSDLEVFYNKELSNPDELIDRNFYKNKDVPLELVFPYIYYFEAKFKLTLSKSYQREIIGNVDLSDNDLPEDIFNVKITYKYENSIVFVRIENSNRKNDGSKAVKLVREYLRAEFRSIKTYVTFKCLGPSPFHANFYVSRDDTLETNQINLIEGIGYDDIEIIIGDKKDFFDISHEDRFMIDFSHELDIFYTCVTTRNWFSHRWSNIKEKISQLEIYQNKRFSPLYYFQKRKLISSVLLDLWVFNNDKIASENEISTRHSKFSYHKDGIIKNYIDREIKKSPKYTVKETIELVQFFEQKNAKSFELGMAFITSVIGGIIGAVITSLSTVAK